ncbi:hypothetical protein AB6A40_002247 [Gnathostoma spinigerum]|uniref:CRAL-TRIO domain-containing protein n=1 Tax=Gnathostoma spinigerum TaxID=75299 RepID=A0ABD6EF69_9BILA
MTVIQIDESDRALIEQLRSQISEELKLLPEYDDDVNLLRWLVGWDRKINVIVPKIKKSLKTVVALGLEKVDLSSIEKITEYCDSVSKSLKYLPGSLLGFDNEGNLISITMIGHIDIHGLLSSTKNSDLYVMKIAESFGALRLIKSQEKLLGRQVGSAIIMDLEGLTSDMLWMPAVKTISNLLTELQELFPDVVRRLFFINVPSFIQMVWTLFSPCLAKQTQQKVRFLGDDWKDELKKCIDPNVLYEHWGGCRKASTPYGHLKSGGKVPSELRYDPANDLPDSKLERISISARSMKCIPINIIVNGGEPKILKWWWRIESGDIDFSVCFSKDNDKTDSISESDILLRPKFRLQTEFVPENGEVLCSTSGTYKLVFDNTYGKLWSKNIRVFYEISGQ